MDGCQLVHQILHYISLYDFRTTLRVHRVSSGMFHILISSICYDIMPSPLFWWCSYQVWTFMETYGLGLKEGCRVCWSFNALQTLPCHVKCGNFCRIMWLSGDFISIMVHSFISFLVCIYNLEMTGFTFLSLLQFFMWNILASSMASISTEYMSFLVGCGTFYLISDFIQKLGCSKYMFIMDS